MELGIKKGSRIVVDILDKVVGNGFEPWKDMTNLTFQVRLFTKNGELHLWIVLPPGVSADQLTEYQWNEIRLYASGASHSTI